MVHYTEPSRYNWMLQYYLRAEGLALSWVGTGRLIFSLNYTDADFTAVADRFVTAAGKMKHDGWWWHDASLTNKDNQAADPERDACRTAQALRARLLLPSWTGSIPAIHVLPGGPQDAKDVDARDKAGHDEDAGTGDQTLRRA